MIDQSPVSVSPVTVLELSILLVVVPIDMVTAGIISAMSPATKDRIATVCSHATMEHLGLMNSIILAPVLIVLNHTISQISDAHVLKLHLKKDQALALLLMPQKPSLS